MYRNGEFEDKIERLRYLSLTTLNVVDISQTGVISQTGFGTNYFKGYTLNGEINQVNNINDTNQLNSTVISPGYLTVAGTVTGGSFNAGGGSGLFGLMFCTELRPQYVTFDNGTGSGNVKIEAGYAVTYELRWSGTGTRSIPITNNFSPGDIVIIRRTGATGYNVNYSGVTIYEPSQSVATGIFNTAARTRIMIYLTGAFHTIVYI